jgi:hypothetical protein
VRRVEDDGTQTLSRSDALGPPETLLPTFLGQLRRALLAEDTECRTCDFWGTCAGYFKWPRRDYECGGVKALFRTLRAAAADLRSDVAKFDASRAGHAP